MSAQRDRVVLVLAIGLSLAVLFVTAGVLYDAIFSEGPGLSDNATQLLTTAFGGMIGVLGSYIGFRAANGASESSGQQSGTDPNPAGPPPALPTVDESSS